MRLNKVIALSLAAAIAVPMLASCGKQKTETVDENGNKIYSYTLNMYTQDDNEYPTQEDTLFNNYIRDNFGIKFVYDRIPRTDWETKTNTYFATGDSPDVTIGGKEMNYKAWGNEGYLAPIDYTKLPNWCALWGDNLDKVVSLASNSDGSFV